MGKYPVPKGSSEILGLEAAGTVESVGDNCGKWKVGEQVMALLGGGGAWKILLYNEVKFVF